MRPPELPAILSTTFTDPARLTPAMSARAGAFIADPGQQVSPARIIRTGTAVAYLDRLSHCHERLQRASRSSQACCQQWSLRGLTGSGSAAEGRRAGVAGALGSR
jgi:hypothetical protein